MASSNFLDLVGLTRFKEKLLDLVEEKLAGKQNAGDYLNASVESSLVHKTGNETIAGTKTFSSTISGNVSGNAGTATTLQTARTIALSGAVTGTATSFNGSKNITIEATSVDGSKVSGSVPSADSAKAVAWSAVTGKPSSFTPSSHNQASNTITAMTSYAKATASSAVAASDSLNTAIGKLEFKIDSNATAISKKANTSDLAAVATSGSYSDLSGTPTSLKNPSSLTLQNSAGTSIGSYDGSAAKTIKLTASTVGLGNVTNESKTTMFTNAALTGTPTAPTATAGTKTTQIATTAFVTNGLSGKADSDHTHSAATTSAAGLMSADDKKKLDGIASGANKYSHPTYTAKSSGFYKVTVDATGHVSATTAVTKADITGLGIPAQDTVYTLPTASSSTLGGVKTTSTVTSTSGLTACPIIGGVPYYKDTNTTYSLSSFGVTATAAELNALDGITATVTELNYCDGVTSNIQTQLNGKLSTSGTAAKATADASGNNIVNTYATKTALNAKLTASSVVVATRTRDSSLPTYGLA